MAINVEELKRYLNIDADNTDYDAELTQLIATAREDLITSTGKQFDENNALVRQFVKLYCYREFNDDTGVGNRLLDIKKMILHSVRFTEAT